jgi:hypothetical protein
MPVCCLRHAMTIKQHTRVWCIKTNHTSQDILRLLTSVSFRIAPTHTSHKLERNSLKPSILISTRSLQGRNKIGRGRLPCTQHQNVAYKKMSKHSNTFHPFLKLRATNKQRPLQIPAHWKFMKMTGLDYIASNSRIADEWTGRDLKGSDYDIIEVLSQHILGRTEGNHTKPQYRLRRESSTVQGALPLREPVQCPNNESSVPVRN